MYHLSAKDEVPRVLQQAYLGHTGVHFRSPSGCHHCLPRHLPPSSPSPCTAQIITSLLCRSGMGRNASLTAVRACKVSPSSIIQVHPCEDHSCMTSSAPLGISAPSKNSQRLSQLQERFTMGSRPNAIWRLTRLLQQACCQVCWSLGHPSTRQCRCRCRTDPPCCSHASRPTHWTRCQHAHQTRPLQANRQHCSFHQCSKKAGPPLRAS